MGRHGRGISIPAVRAPISLFHWVGLGKAKAQENLSLEGVEWRDPAKVRGVG